MTLPIPVNPGLAARHAKCAELGHPGCTHNEREADHTPAAIAGRPETVPDPALTLAGIRAARGVRYSPPPTETVVDRAAIASGKRRSNIRAYRDAQRST